MKKPKITKEEKKATSDIETIKQEEKVVNTEEAKPKERTIFTVTKEYFNSYKNKSPWFFVVMSIYLLFYIFIVLVSSIRVPYTRLTPGVIEAAVSQNQNKSDYVFQKDYLKDYKYANIFTVAVYQKRRISVIDYWLTKLNREHYGELIPLNKTGGNYLPDDEDFKESRLMMRTSLEASVVVAFKEASKKDPKIMIDYSFLGLEIQGCYNKELNNFPQGHVIQKLDGEALTSLKHFSNIVSSKNKSEFDVTILDPEKNVTYEAKIKSDTNHKFGLYLAEKVKINKTVPEVTIKKNLSSGGPSGGMMQTMALYQALLRSDKLNKIRIAGSGTISLDGAVGNIGGVKLKVITCSYNNCQYFLSCGNGTNPNFKDAEAEAKRLKTKMIVKEIKNFSDVVKFIDELIEGK